MSGTSSRKMKNQPKKLNSAPLNPVQNYFKSFAANLAAIFIASVLFAAAFPNLLAEKGIPILAWIAYVPVFWVIRRCSVKTAFFWGALYGYTAYGLFNYWLSVFHPLAGLIVGSIYLFYLMLLFPLLKIAIMLFPKRGYILQWIFWISFEYLRIQGFLGYAYGITGYSQWTMIPVMQIASVTGIWGVSAIVVFPSAIIASFLPIAKASVKGEYLKLEFWKKTIADFFKKEKIAVCAWAVALIFILIFGFASQIDYSGAQKAKMALIQHNTDPWRGGIHQYRLNYEVLKRLSDEALHAHPDLDLVVWSETAFVPRIHWHTTIRDDPQSWILVKELIDYLSSQDVPFLLGNDDARKDSSKNPYGDNRIDYNAAMLYERGVNTGLYRKLHLVPFTEHFPYEKELPWIYEALKNADTHFWERGSEAKVFNTGKLKFSTPICFEDTFGYLSRDFVRNGAELIVNISNDAWSASLPAQNQHLSMAVFRAVENRRSMVRSTASGQTCGVDPNGRILAMAPPFREAWLAVEVPIITVSSFYTRYGDWLAFVFLALSAALLIFGAARVIIKKYVRPS